MTERFSSFAEFWPHYLREHSQPRTRTIHCAGTTTALLLVTIGLAFGPWWLLVIAPLAGYGPAWIGHLCIENNRPATFKHPVWSLLSDFRMVFLWITLRLKSELKSAGLTGTTNDLPDPN